jgi:flagellar biosynthesis GTPase FlhF
MRIERLEAEDTKSGLRELAQRFGDDVLIIANTRQTGKNHFVFAVDDTPLASAGLWQEESPALTITPQASAARFVAAQEPAANSGSAQTAAPALATAALTGVQELSLLLKTEFESLRRALRETHNSPSRDSAPEGFQLSEHLDDVAISARLMKKMQALTAHCTCTSDARQLLQEFLLENLPASTELPLEPGVHFLVGQAGVGKTVNAFRLASHLLEQGRQAIVVGYKPTRDGTWTQLQLLGAKRGIDVYQAAEWSMLLSIINEHMGHASILVELPSALDFTELQRLQNDLTFANFHLLVAKDTASTSSRGFRQGTGLSFASTWITRLDSPGACWPLVETLLETRTPLLFAGAGPLPASPLITLDKRMLAEEVLKEIAD